MLIDVDQSQLVLVDYQTRLMPAIFGGAEALANGIRMAKVAALLEVPTFATAQNPSRLGENDPTITSLAQRTLNKMHFSAVSEGLVEWLRPPMAPQRHGYRGNQSSGSRGADSRAGASNGGGNARSMPKHLQQRAPEPDEDGRNLVLLAGCEAHVCLLQTALELLDAEFDVWVVADACSSRTERNRDAAFDRLATAGIELVSTEMVIFEWLRSADHPDFKEVLPLIK